MSNPALRKLSHLEAHHRFAITFLFAALVCTAVTGRISLAKQTIVTWDAYAFCYLALSWAPILTTQPRVAIRLAKLQHSSRMFIFAFVLVAACASLGAVAFLLSNAKGLPKQPFATHILAAIGTVVLSWLLVHTIFALHYAYLYYQSSPTAPHRGGLLFPDGEKIEPDYADFAYFSFVIGMTSQVSDVQIASPNLRRWALLHGMISFGFNAAILGLSINILSGLFN